MDGQLGLPCLASAPFYWCNNTPISSGEAAVFTTPQPPPASDNGAPYQGGESQGSVRRYLGVGVGGGEFLLKLDKNHTFFLWTKERELGGPTDDTAKFSQEDPPTMISGPIASSPMMGAVQSWVVIKRAAAAP